MGEAKRLFALDRFNRPENLYNLSADEIVPEDSIAD